jgi:hypothetical protein
MTPASAAIHGAKENIKNGVRREVEEEGGALPTQTGPAWKYVELQIAGGWEVKVSRSTGQHFCVHLDSGERVLSVGGSALRVTLLN